MSDFTFPEWDYSDVVPPAPMDINKLKGHIPDSVISQIPEVMSTFKIDSVLPLSHFLSQCAHESINFKATVENLNYSSTALLKTFKKYFPTEEKALQYHRKPEKIGNLVYANRMGNGPESSGDGYRYRGRGYIQLTGKINYRAFNSVVEDDVITNPELVATKYPLLSAAWYWDSRKLNDIASQGSSVEIITKITKKINGGTNGLADRIVQFNRIFPLLDG